MDLFFWIIDLLIPTVTFLMGILFILCPPKKINMIYGFRTFRSMSSQKAWDHAHRISGRIYIWVGAGIALLVTADKLLLPVEPQWLSLIHAAIGMAGLIVPIPFVEKKLDEKFKS